MCRGGLPRGISCSQRSGYALLRGRSSNSLQWRGKSTPSVQLTVRGTQAERAQPKSVLGSYREASHRGTSGGTAVMKVA